MYRDKVSLIDMDDESEGCAESQRVKLKGILIFYLLVKLKYLKQKK